MSDFIREVDEEYRRERLASFLRRFQVPLVLLVVLIVAGAGGWRWYVDRQVAEAQSANMRYDAAATQARDGHPAEAEASYAKLVDAGPAGYAVLARLRKAEVQSLHDPKGAAEAFDSIATDTAAGSPALRDLAQYRGALLRVDFDDPKAFENRYGRFALEGFAFHDGMRELLALAAMKRGDEKAAGRYLDDIAVDPLSPPALRSRAQAFRQLVNAGSATPTAKSVGPASVTPLNASTAPAPAAAGAEPAPAGAPSASSAQPVH